MRPEIDNELRDVIPPLADGELEQLRESISVEGCRDAIIVWDETNLVVDGHNRLAICDELGVSFEVKRMSFDSRDDVVAWMCGNNLARRNLTTIARNDLVGRRYNAMKRSQGRPAEETGQSDRFISGDTDARLGDRVGVSAKGVRRAAKLSDALDAIENAGIPRSEFTDGKRNVKQSGILDLGKIAADNPKKAKQVWDKVAAEGPNQGAIKAGIREVNNDEAIEAIKATPNASNDLVTVLHGDCRDLSKGLDDGSVDAIITDPPYPEEYLYTFDALAEIAMSVLKPGGWCITYTGKKHLDEVMRRMVDGGLVYYWQIVFLQTVSPVVHDRTVNSDYKPILLFQKPPVTKGPQYFRDVIQGSGVEKGGHEWQQSADGFSWLIETFTNVNDLVLEPFAGAGTCPLVCQQLNRRCVAYEIDQGSHAHCVQRLKEQDAA